MSAKNKIKLALNQSTNVDIKKKYIQAPKNLKKVLFYNRFDCLKINHLNNNNNGFWFNTFFLCFYRF